MITKHLTPKDRQRKQFRPGIFLFILLCALCVLSGEKGKAHELSPPANAGTTTLSPPSPGTSDTRMVVTVRADGGRYGFNLALPGTENAKYFDTGDYIYDKASIAWSQTDAVGQWNDHVTHNDSTGWVNYKDKRIWQTPVVASNPNYTVRVAGKRRKKGGGGPGPVVWEDWSAEAKQFAVQVDTPTQDEILYLEDTVSISAKAVFDPDVVTFTKLHLIMALLHE